MAKDYSKEKNPRLLRVAIHHENDPALISQAMNRLAEITPERDQPALKGIRQTYSNRIAKLGAPDTTNAPATPQQKGKRDAPKDALAKDIAYAAKGGANRAFTERVRRCAKKAGRPIPEDQGSFQKYPDRTPSATQAKTPRLSRRDERRYREAAGRGDETAIEALRASGKATSLDEQRFRNAAAANASARQRNQPPAGSWASTVRPSSSTSGQGDPPWLEEALKFVDPQHKDKARHNARRTYADLVSKGRPESEIRREIDGFVSEHLKRSNARDAEKLRRQWGNEGQTR